MTTIQHVHHELTLRSLDPERDAGALWAVAQPLRPGEASALRWIRSYTMCRSAEEYRSALRSTACLPAREEYTVCRGETVLGFVCFQDLHTAAEWGVWIGAGWRATPAYHDAMAQSFIELFEVRGLHRVQFRIHVDNQAALRAAEDRGGLVAEGRLRETFREADGTYADEKVFGILRPEWDRLKPIVLTAMLHPRLPYPGAPFLATLPFAGME